MTCLLMFSKYEWDPWRKQPISLVSLKRVSGAMITYLYVAYVYMEIALPKPPNIVVKRLKQEQREW